MLFGADTALEVSREGGTVVAIVSAVVAVISAAFIWLKNRDDNWYKLEVIKHENSIEESHNKIKILELSDSLKNAQIQANIEETKKVQNDRDECRKRLAETERKLSERMQNVENAVSQSGIHVLKPNSGDNK